jgi:hypothetical protein
VLDLASVLNQSPSLLRRQEQDSINWLTTWRNVSPQYNVVSLTLVHELFICSKGKGKVVPMLN